ncbi:MAG: class II aldolase/adducin family protein [Pirellulales bacterium]|nr:class II aldolase/adducin family protein [Pirellulales bacterium]
MPTLEQLKQEICDIGKRLYQRGFAAANDGNITYRVSDNEVLCTPTMHSKGFLKPEDICLIDIQGNQLAGAKKRSSEALLHLEIMKARSDVRSVVHCHPPYATAFAVAREAVPSCVLPEVEVFLGNVPIARYETPSTQAFAETILPFVHQSNVVMLANHGTVSFGETVERAYWWTEILDAHCRILLLAKQIGRVEFLSPQHTRELIDLKKKWGYADPRQDSAYADADLFADDVFRASWAECGVHAGAFGAPAWSRAAAQCNQKPSAGPLPSFDEEAFIERVAQRVAQKLQASMSHDASH